MQRDSWGGLTTQYEKQDGMYFQRSPTTETCAWTQMLLQTRTTRLKCVAPLSPEESAFESFAQPATPQISSLSALTLAQEATLFGQLPPPSLETSPTYTRDRVLLGVEASHVVTRGAHHDWCGALHVEHNAACIQITRPGALIRDAA